MSAFTLRFQPRPSPAVIEMLDARARKNEFRVQWSDVPHFERSYALIEDADDSIADELAKTAAIVESPVIVLALRPKPKEALQLLEAALGGPGRPQGIRRCELANDALIVEWDLDTTPAALVLAVIRTELARIGASCINEVLAPLPLAWWTRIAAEGLSAPDIAPDRVLEALIEAHDVVA